MRTGGENREYVTLTVAGRNSYQWKKQHLEGSTQFICTIQIQNNFEE